MKSKQTVLIEQIIRDSFVVNEQSKNISTDVIKQAFGKLSNVTWSDGANIYNQIDSHLNTIKQYRWYFLIKSRAEGAKRSENVLTRVNAISQLLDAKKSQIQAQLGNLNFDDYIWIVSLLEGKGGKRTPATQDDVTTDVDMLRKTQLFALEGIHKSDLEPITISPKYRNIYDISQLSQLKPKQETPEVEQEVTPIPNKIGGWTEVLGAGGKVHKSSDEYYIKLMQKYYIQFFTIFKDEYMPDPRYLMAKDSKGVSGMERFDNFMKKATGIYGDNTRFIAYVNQNIDESEFQGIFMPGRSGPYVTVTTLDEILRMLLGKGITVESVISEQMKSKKQQKDDADKLQQLLIQQQAEEEAARKAAEEEEEAARKAAEEKKRNQGGGERKPTPPPTPPPGPSPETGDKFIGAPHLGEIRKNYWIETIDNSQYICRIIPKTPAFSSLWKPIDGMINEMPGQVYNYGIRCVNKNNAKDRFIIYVYYGDSPTSFGDDIWGTVPSAKDDPGHKWGEKGYYLIKGIIKFEENDVPVNKWKIISDIRTQKEQSTTLKGMKTNKNILNYFKEGGVPSELKNLYSADSKDKKFRYAVDANSFRYEQLPGPKRTVGILYAGTAGGGTWINEYMTGIKMIRNYDYLKKVIDLMKIAEVSKSDKIGFSTISGIPAARFYNNYISQQWSDEWVLWMKEAMYNTNDYFKAGGGEPKPGVRFMPEVHKDYIYSSATLNVQGGSYNQNPLCRQIYGEMNRNTTEYKRVYDHFSDYSDQLQLTDNGGLLTNNSINFVLEKPLYR